MQGTTTRTGFGDAFFIIKPPQCEAFAAFK